MSNTNPLVIRFKAALQKAYNAHQIRQTRGAIAGQPVSAADITDFGKAIFGPKATPDQRKELIRFHMLRWNKDLGVSFPKFVWKEYKYVQTKLHDKTFWDKVGEFAMDVMKSPIFSAVIGIATAAIPGVGAVLAPLAVFVQRKVTDLVDKAIHHESVDAGEVLASAAQLAEQGAGAIAPNSGIAQAIHEGRTTVEKVVGAAKQVVAIAKAHANPHVTQPLVHARRMVVKAQLGDAAAKHQIATLAAGAKAGSKAHLEAFAWVTAVQHGMAKGHVPGPHQQEIAEHVDLHTRIAVDEVGPDEDDAYEEQAEREAAEDEEYERECACAGEYSGVGAFHLPPLKKKPQPKLRFAAPPPPPARITPPKAAIISAYHAQTRPAAKAIPGKTVAKTAIAPGLAMILKATPAAQRQMTQLGVTKAQGLVLARAAEAGGLSRAADVADKMGLPPDAASLAGGLGTSLVRSDDPDRPDGGLSEEESSGYDAGEEYEGPTQDEADPEESYGYGGGGYHPWEPPRDGSSYGWDEEGY